MAAHKRPPLSGSHKELIFLHVRPIRFPSMDRCEGGCLCIRMMCTWREAPRCQIEWVSQWVDLLHAENTRQKHRIYADDFMSRIYFKEKICIQSWFISYEGRPGKRMGQGIIKVRPSIWQWVIFQIAGPILVWKLYLSEISFGISDIFEFQLSL